MHLVLTLQDFKGAAALSAQAKALAAQAGVAAAKAQKLRQQVLPRCKHVCVSVHVNLFAELLATLAARHSDKFAASGLMNTACWDMYSHWQQALCIPVNLPLSQLHFAGSGLPTPTHPPPKPPQ